MRRWISTLAALVVIAAPVAGEKVAQGGDESPGVAGPAASLTDFELIQYTATGRLSPEGVMSLDNNGDILIWNIVAFVDHDVDGHVFHFVPCN